MATKVDYKILKSDIMKSLRNIEGTKFEVDYKKLCDLVEDIGLIPLFSGIKSEKISTNKIPYMSEYINGSRLSWITEGKESTIIVFAVTEGLDERGNGLIADLLKKQVDDPGLDKVNKMADFVANYPCYFAQIISYINNDPPSKFKKASYAIDCRANKVVMKSPEYQYNPKDF